MKIIDKIKIHEDLHSVRQPVIAFLGDSVTQGCFDIYVKDGEIKTVVEPTDGYHERLKGF